MVLVLYRCTETVLFWEAEGRQVPAAQPPEGFASLSAFEGQENQPGVVAGPGIPALRRQRQEDCMLVTHETMPKEQTKAKMAGSSEMLPLPLRWEIRGFSLLVNVV